MNLLSVITETDGAGNFWERRLPVKTVTANVDRDEYERDLRRRQEEHLKTVRGGANWRPCAHDQCSECHGTGVKLNGSRCIHMIACNCPKCSFYC